MCCILAVHSIQVSSKNKMSFTSFHTRSTMNVSSTRTHVISSMTAVTLMVVAVTTAALASSSAAGPYSSSRIITQQVLPQFGAVDLWKVVEAMARIICSWEIRLQLQEQSQHQILFQVNSL